MKKLLFCIPLMLLPILANANPVEVDGFWYNLVRKAQIAEVTSNPSGDKYTGEVTILDKFTYDGVEYSVTKIADYAFSYCEGLSSVAFPNSLTSIGEHAFDGCGLTSITIGNCVTSIGSNAFRGCSNLISVTIGNSIASIGKYAFDECYSLKLVNIIDIKAWCEIHFYNESSNPLTRTGKIYLNGEEIKDLVIPSSLTSITRCAFDGCSGLTSVTIPNSVTSIGEAAFYGCNNLTSVTIGNSVTSINHYAFACCELLANVYCMPEQVSDYYRDDCLYTDYYAFNNSYQEYITLHVPAASVEAYKAIEPWKSFKEVVALDGGEIPVTPQCATPSINLVDGKITFSCETEGVTYISNVSVNDAKDYYDNEISAPKKFKVTVYATKANYDNSDTVTAEFDFSGDTSLSGDVDGNGIVNVADHVKLSSIILDQNE